MTVILGIPGQNPGGSPFPGAPGADDDDVPVVDGVEHDNDFSLALVPNIGSELCAELATDPDPEVRSAIAGHADCDEVTRGLLAVDPDPGVRAALVRSGFVSPEIFLDDASPAVLADVARATTQRSTVDTLVAHPTPGVRAGCAASSAVSPAQLRVLAADADGFVAETAREVCSSRGVTVDGPPAPVGAPLDGPQTVAALGSEDPSERHAAVVRGVVSAAQLASLLSDDDERVRAAVAEHHLLDPVGVAAAAADESGRVRRAVASRRDLSPSLELTLVGDDQPAVSNAVLLNGSSPQRLDGVEVERLVALGLTAELLSRLETLAPDAFVDAASVVSSWSGTLGELAEVFSLVG